MTIAPTTPVSDPAREVLNQAPPLQPIDLLASDLALRGGGCARGRRVGSRRDPRSGRHRRQRRGAGAQPPRRAQRAAAGDPRPLRQPHRPGRSGPVVALAAARCGRARDPQPAVARAEARSARRPRGHVHALQQRQRRRHVSGLDDLRRDAGAARRRARAGRRMGAAADEHRLRARRAGRDGDDRAPGRLRRARQHHTRRARSGTACTRSTVTSGSARIRRATCSWCSRRRRAGCRASWSSADRGWSSSA